MMRCFSWQLQQVGLRRELRAENQVAHDIDSVVYADAFIPAGYHAAIHLERVCERTVAVANDIGMAKMLVARKKDCHLCVSLPFIR